MTAASPDNYDARYADWKNWGDETFGRLSSRDKAYFDAEMKRGGIALGRGARVLEIGFGNGAFLAYARQRGWSVVGTELNPPLFEAARAQGYDVHLAGGLEAFADDGFDAVFAFDVVEHIEGAQLVSFFTEVKRVCKPGALFVMRVPNGDSPFGLLHQNGDITHVSAIGRHKMDYVAGICGARIVHYGGEHVLFRDRNPRIAIMRALGAPIRGVLNFVTQCVMFPEMRIAFYSKNTVYALRMKSPGA